MLQIQSAGSFGSNYRQEMGRRMMITPKIGSGPIAGTQCETDADGYPSNLETIEYLQAVVSNLLIKNQTMRFEVYSLRQRLTAIQRLRFGSSSSELGSVISPDMLFVLHDLCGTHKSLSLE